MKLPKYALPKVRGCPALLSPRGCTQCGHRLSHGCVGTPGQDGQGPVAVLPPAPLPSAPHQPPACPASCRLRASAVLLPLPAGLSPELRPPMCCLRERHSPLSLQAGLASLSSSTPPSPALSWRSGPASAYQPLLSSAWCGAWHSRCSMSAAPFPSPDRQTRGAGGAQALLPA